MDEDARERPYGQMNDINDDCLVKAYGWEVRRLVEDGDEMVREVARIQAEAFHQPVALFDDVFFQFFQVLLIKPFFEKYESDS